MEAQLCACGCGHPLREERSPSRKGRFLRGHGRKNGLGYRPVAPRLWANVEKTDSCWIWRGAVENSGYGRIGINGKRDGVHRVSWVLANNRPIPEGMEVRHTCDNSLCVRPDHLELGTHRENIADKIARSRQARGTSNGAAVLTEEQVAEIRRCPRLRGNRKALAIEFGVSESTIKQIRAGLIWKHVRGVA